MSSLTETEQERPGLLARLGANVGAVKLGPRITDRPAPEPPPTAESPPAPEPPPDPTDNAGNTDSGVGAGLLADVRDEIRHYVSLSTEEEADAIALWVMHTHCIEAADSTPYLSIWSPEKRSGKTRLLEVLDLLVNNPWRVGRITVAAMMRKAAKGQPTMLLDEVDSAVRSQGEYGEAIRSMLNAGHKRGGVATVAVRQGGDWEPADFPVYGPKALASIGPLWDTVRDRSIEIRLRRQPPGERVGRFRQRVVVPAFKELQARLVRWAKAHIATLTNARPVVPDALDDRAADYWEPLMAIADLVGGDWPERARRAALALSIKEGESTLGVGLLADIRHIFNSSNTGDHIKSTHLVASLIAIEEAPWGNLWGRPLDLRRLSGLLKDYGITPKQIRVDGGNQLRGYERADFADAWLRYLPAEGGDTEASPER